MVQPLNICYLCYRVLFSWSELSPLRHMLMHWYSWLNVTQSSSVSGMAFWLQYATYAIFRRVSFSRLLDCWIVVINECRNRRQDPLMLALQAEGFRHKGWANHNLRTELPHRCSTWIRRLPPPPWYTVVSCRNHICASLWPINEFLSRKH